jgi:hypothetical protein
LSPEDIRLFQLLPGQPGEPLAGNLVPTSLATGPSYQAVSHAWAHDEDNEELLCDGQVLHIGKSLKDMLSHLRYRDEIAILWIDSICINQQDPDERSAQVSLMGRIYKEASLVLIWLGLEDEHTKAAFAVMDQAWETFHSAKTPENPSPTMSQLLQCGFPPPSDLRWRDSFVPLVERRWFSRLWIIQEVALAEYKAFILAGSQWYPWERLSHVLIMAASTGMESSHGLRAMAASELAFIARSAHPDFIDPVWPRDRTLAEYLSVTMGCPVSDHHDHIFGLLGLCTDAASLRQKGLVDYSIAVPNLFIAVTTHYLTSSNSSLDLLQIINGYKTEYRHTLPSWVPDYSQGRMSLRRLPRLPRRNTICACPVPTVSADGRVLHLRGKFLTRVRYIGRLCEFSALPAVYVLLFLEHWRHLAHRHTHGIMSAEEVDEAFARTLIADGWTDAQGSAPDSYRDMYLLYLEQFRRSFHAVTIMENSKYSKTFGYQTLMHNACALRLFVLMRDGQMGLVPFGTKVGDEVVRFHGNSAPFVARKDKKSGLYMLVGEAYVHGMMQPEDCTVAQYEDISLK